MIPIVLHDPERVANLLSQASIYAQYQDHLVCESPLGYYIIHPDGKTALTFAGMVVHTRTSQEAGWLIDQIKALPRRTTSANTTARRPTIKKTTTNSTRRSTSARSSKRANTPTSRR